MAVHMTLDSRRVLRVLARAAMAMAMRRVRVVCMPITTRVEPSSW